MNSFGSFRRKLQTFKIQANFHTNPNCLLHDIDGPKNDFDLLLFRNHLCEDNFLKFLVTKTERCENKRIFYSVIRINVINVRRPKLIQLAMMETHNLIEPKKLTRPITNKNGLLRTDKILSLISQAVLAGQCRMYTVYATPKTSHEKCRKICKSKQSCQLAHNFREKLQFI